MTVAGYVLAGGRSSRMGQDKALLPLGSGAMAQQITNAVFQALGNVTLVGDPEKYSGLGYPVTPDLRPGHGPLAGLESALAHSRSEWNLILACDLARTNSNFLSGLCSQALQLPEIFDCLVPQGPDLRLQPLCALYRHRCLGAVSHSLDNGVRRLTHVVTALNMSVQKVSDLAVFQNLNTPEDWNRYINE